MRFNKEDKYSNFIRVAESPDLISWIISIIIFPLFFINIEIYFLHKKIEKMGKREKWIYQKALNDGMTFVNLDTACAYSPSRVCNYRIDIPNELAREGDHIVFSLRR